MIKNFKWLFLLSLTIAACSSNDDEGTATEEPITAGTADFSKYIALGNSLTAGYSDNALFKRGQEHAYPSILSQQFALAGGGSFATPFVGDDNIGGLLLGGTPIQGSRLVVTGFSNGAPSIGNLPLAPVTEVTNHLAGPFNNMGVPGAKSFHLIAPGYGNPAGVATGQANPYYARFASSATSTVLGDAIAQNPTFFSLWIGNNDVLAYATSGGTGVNQAGNPDPATYGPNDITDPAVFQNVYSGLLDGLTSGGAKGVVGNIPYVTTIPFFRTVPYNPVPLPAANVLALNSGYAPYNGGLQAALANGLITPQEAERRTITFHEGAGNAVVIVDSYLTNLAVLGLPSYRQATAEDLLILPSRTFIGTTVGGNPAAVNGLSVPLADSWVLSKDEVAEVKTATDAFNASIATLAEAKGLALMDANALMSQLYNGGVRVGNYHMTASFFVGGAFSLDGVHPSARGYAYIANQFLAAINAKYGSNFKGVKPEDYQIQYPAILN
ncbi:MAG: G-D-S-L family lipolytic protein [Flavobacterium sp.]|nr:MAG: G-D-S-L family lipolytic protein [Flavobacterium sp.]